MDLTELGFVAVFVALAVVGFLLHRREGRNIAARLRRQAERLGGKIKPAGLLWNYPRVTVPDGDGEIVLSAAAAGGRDVASPTRLSAFFTHSAGRDFRLLLNDTSRHDRINRLFGASELSVGDSPFDRRFTLKSGDRNRALALLDADTRARLMAFSARPVEVVIQNGRCTLLIYGAGTEDGDYDWLVATARFLRRRLTAMSGR